MTTNITLCHINAYCVFCNKIVAEQLRERLPELAGIVVFGATSSGKEQGSGACSSSEVG